ncbi:MAG: UDP-3-O-(3-hydroxymyristoyl)glucosamine N-acyltransferase [Bacteroidia bacterium]|nr:UDP-3-O-(3-hydroxymyristoyl)glucosamine N-acyltransferase [Bacteroidia bacterium]
MQNFSIKDLKNTLGENIQFAGDRSDITFVNAKSIFDADSNSLTWISSSRNDKDVLIKNSTASIIICDDKIDTAKFKNKCFVIVENPRLAFLRIIKSLFSNLPAWGIHPTAYIHPEAIVNKNSHIGPFTYIGKCEINEGCIIYGHNYIYDNVKIGKNVIIHAGTVIGADGFGYEKNTDGELEKFPHIGGVIIEDDVEIGSNTCIDRGTLGNTQIGYGAKIDNLVHIAHNVIIGKHTAVIANSMIGGSTKIGDYSWIAPSASLRDTIQIGNKVTVGVAAVVTKSIPDNETWTGNPAKPLDEFLEIQKKIKNL